MAGWGTVVEIQELNFWISINMSSQIKLVYLKGQFWVLFCFLSFSSFFKKTFIKVYSILQRF